MVNFRADNGDSSLSKLVCFFDVEEICSFFLSVSLIDLEVDLELELDADEDDVAGVVLPAGG